MGEAPSLGRYCLETAPGRYFDTLEHLERGQDELSGARMLAGQEREAVEGRLLRLHRAQVLVIPSFECNLRCPHCYVGHLLEKPTGSGHGTTDPSLLSAFIDRVSAYPGWGVDWVALVGGEPFLHPDLIRHLLERHDLKFDVTTNGVWDFDGVADILAHPRLRNITFSIDGVPEHHNRVRRALDHTPGTFGIVYANLHRTARLISSLGTGCRVVAQGSVLSGVGGVHWSDEHLRRYIGLMLLAGVARENISLGHAAPSVIRPAVSAGYRGVVAQARRFLPCCDYRLGYLMVVSAGMVYGSYHKIASAEPLGSLDDDLDKIIGRQRQQILSGMPLLADPVCMEQCKAVGVCWGLCSNSDLATGGIESGADNEAGTFGPNRLGLRCRPSSICDRTFKEEKLLLDLVGTTGEK